MENIKFNSELGQDKFVLNILNFKKNGYFIELGSNHPIKFNNTYLLEKKYNWKGIMVEYEDTYLDLYKIYRKNSLHIISDATKINYEKVFQDNNIPTEIDYLQIDLEPKNESTINTLKIFDETIFSNYKFAVVTFEHDVFRNFCVDTRNKSREIFKKHNYELIFSDVNNKHNPIEDWYIHPDLVDIEHVYKIKNLNTVNYDLNYFTGKSIPYKKIKYE